MSFSLANPVILTIVIIGFVLLCLATVWVYWQGWKILDGLSSAIWTRNKS